MGQDITSLWHWDPPDNKPAHIRDRTERFEAMRHPDPLSCDIKDLHDAMQDMLDFQRSSPAQDLADAKSVVCQVSQDGNQVNLKFSSDSSFALFGVPMFKYRDSEHSQISVDSPGQLRSSEGILAWANDVVGGNDEELPFQGPNKSF